VTTETKPSSEWILQELEQECLKYLTLRTKLRQMPPGEERDDLEADLYAWLTQLESTAIQARAAIDQETDAMDDADE